MKTLSNDSLVREHRERASVAIDVHAQRAARTILARLPKQISRRLSLQILAQIIAKEFKTEVGFEFSFVVEHKGNTYNHSCKITEVIPKKKIAYT